MAALSKQTAPRRRGASQPPRSRAFFLELLLNMLVFALCSVVALQVFAEAKMTTDRSAALSTLTIEAKELAGYYKVTSGDVGELVSSAVRGDFGELTSNGALVYYYDRSYQLTEASSAYYWLELAPVLGMGGSAKGIEISAYQMGPPSGDSIDLLFNFTVVNYQPLPPQQAQGGR